MGKNDKPNGAKVGWRLRETTYPFANEFIKLRQDRVDLQGNGEITFTYQDHPGAVCIVPVTPEGEIVMIRQYRYTVDDWCLEIPAGGMHDAEGASAEEVARKELEEEIGATFDELRLVADFYTSNGQSNEAIQLYVALGVCLGGDTKHEATEQIEIRPTPAKEAVRMARGGEIKDGTSALSILLCEDLLRNEGYL